MKGLIPFASDVLIKNFLHSSTTDSGDRITVTVGTYTQIVNMFKIIVLFNPNSRMFEI